MSEAHLKNVIEAALLAAGKPLQLGELAQLFEEHARPENAALRAGLEALATDYEGRGIEIKETATGFRIQVRKELAPEISRLWPERPPRYSRALLETLALIAYRQPITRAEIEAVRGVAVNPNIIKTLLERNWVRVVGTRDVPGRPELLGTTKEFLDYFGLKSLEDLPPLAELKAMGDINLQLDLANGQAAAAAAGVAEAAATEVSAEPGPVEAGAPEQAPSAEDGGDQNAAVAEAGTAETADADEADGDESKADQHYDEAVESVATESDAEADAAVESAAANKPADSDADESDDSDESDDADESDETEEEIAERELVRAENEASGADEQSDYEQSDEDDDDSDDPEQDSRELVAARRDFGD
jgi:segregation and condensation protein B